MKEIKKQPRKGTKSYESWKFIAKRKGEEYANEIYALNRKYHHAKNGTHGHRREDMEKYRSGKTEFNAVLEHLYNGHRNPYDIYFCAWCGDNIDWSDQTSTASKDNFIYCPSSKVGSIGKSSKCNIDMHQSRAKSSALSTIEAVCKIIDQCYKCVGKCKSYHYPYAFSQDHWIARVNGGQDTNENIKMICQPCNNSKGTKDGESWLKTDGGWDCMVSYGEDVAIENLKIYCHHLKLQKRCAGLINGDIVPHKEELKYAPKLLAWIMKHGYPIQ